MLKNLPDINYKGIPSKNLISKAVVIENVLRRYQVFYPYTIHDGERPDTIAHDYYGNPEYDWIIYHCNKIVDPYYDWPLTYTQFLSYLTSKYGSINIAKTLIDHYHYVGVGGQPQEEIDMIQYTISPDTYDLYTTDEKKGWMPVYAYENEYNINEKKREIVLLSNEYLPQLIKEVSEVFDV